MIRKDSNYKRQIFAMNIVLIGMPGTGKSMIGKKLAKNLNHDFIDIDTLIKRKTKMGLQDYIDKYGDEAFIKIEEETVLNLNIENSIIAPGGSIIYSEKAINHLKKNSFIIFLDISLEALKYQVKNIDNRGIVYLRKKSYEELYNERHSQYQRYADITLKINNLTTEQVIKRIKRIYTRY